MRRLVRRIVGSAIIALVVLALALQVGLAIRTGRPFYGVNYYGQPLGVVYPIAGVVLVGGVAAFVYGGRLLSARRRRRGKGGPAA